MSGQKLTHRKKNQQAVYLKIDVWASHSGAVCRRRCVPPCVKNKDHSNTAGLALEPDSSSMLEIYVGFCAEGLTWGVAVRTAVLLYILSRESKSSWSSTSKQDREDDRATSVSEQSSPWPQSLPGWQPSCERLPPASWPVVGLGCGMMALCCAAIYCVVYRCGGPSINCAAVFCQQEIIRQYIDNRHNSLNTADTGCLKYLCRAISTAL